MSVSTLSRVRTVVTGVAGAPYYINAYFDHSVGTVQNRIDAWHKFLTANDTGPFIPGGSVWTTEGQVPVIDAASGNITSMESGTQKQVTGSSGTTVLPHGNQYLHRWHTASYIGGRELRGRTYQPLPYLASMDTGNGGLTSAAVTSLQNAENTLLGDITVGFCVWSRKHGVAQRVVSASPWNQYGIQRSRRD